MFRRTVGAAVVLSLAIGLGACAAPPPKPDNEPVSADFTYVGSAIRAVVSPDEPLAIAVPGLGRITGPSGAFSAKGELVVRLLSAETPADSFVTAGGPGVDVTFEGTELISPLTVFFDDPAVVGAAPGDSLPLVLHRPDGAPWEAVALDYTPDGVPYIITSDFSPNIFGWIDLPAFARGIGDDISNWVGGGTTPRGCDGGAPSWATVSGNQQLAHLCAISNTETGSGAIRAEVQVQSNRQYYQWVTVPAGNDYLWVDNQPDFIRAAIGKVTGHDPSREVLLAEGNWLTAGYQQTATYQEKKFNVYSDKWSTAFDLLGQLFALEPDKGGWSTMLILVATCSEFLTSADALELLKCAILQGTEKLSDPNKAFAAAMDVLGEKSYAEEFSKKLKNLSGFLTWVGKAVKYVGWYLLGRSLLVRLLDWWQSASTKDIGVFTLQLTALQQAAPPPVQTPPSAAPPPTTVVPPSAPQPPASPSGYVGDGGYVGYAKNSRSSTDPNFYYWHYLALCVSNLTPGTYTLRFSSDTVSDYFSMAASLPANGCISTGQQGGTLTQGGTSSDWYSIEVVGQFTTARYQPWT